MKKVCVLVLAMLVLFASVSYAACPVCGLAESDNYAKAAAGKLSRGIANAGFGWVELFRQPAINKNPWEGVGRGFVHTIGRTGSGVLEAGTFFIPAAKIPLLSPNCPVCMLGSSKS